MIRLLLLFENHFVSFVLFCNLYHLKTWFLIHLGGHSTSNCMASSEELTIPLLDESTETAVTPAVTFTKTYKSCLNKLLAVFYSLFLCWQLTGMCLYVFRAVVCFRLKVLTYKCSSNVAFSYSAEAEFVWLATSALHVIITIVILQKCADFPGYKAIFQRLKHQPQFWSLFFLLLAALSRYVMLTIFSKMALYHVIVLFALGDILRFSLIVIVNYIQLNTMRQRCNVCLFIFAKLTLLVFFIENLVNFLVSFLQFAMKIEDFSGEEKEGYSHVEITYTLLHKFATTYFDFKICNFFWQKLFRDDRDIISNHKGSIFLS